MTTCRREPCSSCPYRMDVPSGVWSDEEYEKLRDYDNETFNQPMGPFHCHATPTHLCHGWVVTHSNRAAILGGQYDLLALRMFPLTGDIPESEVVLWGSGNDAADHGQADSARPSPEAVATAQKLMRKYPRLRKADNGQDQAPGSEDDGDAGGDPSTGEPARRRAVG